ncbi:MAG: hypothetical protein ACON4U_19055 [Myxococcota bacterium]
MWAVWMMSCSMDDCPPNAILAPTGACIINDNTLNADTAKMDSGDASTDSNLNWQRLDEQCLPTTDGTDPIFQTAELFVQDYVFAEIIDSEADLDNAALWTVGEGGLMAFDLSEVDSPSFTKATHPTDWDHRFYQLVLGTYPALYATHRDEGLAVYSRTDVSQPELITTIETNNLGGGTVVNERLYITDHTGGLHTFDVSNPMQPSLISTQDYSGSPWKAIAHGNFLYLADNQKGVVVFGIHDPDSPLYLGHTVAKGGVQDLTISEDGNALYAAVGAFGLETFSLDNPERPESVGHIPIHHSAVAVDIGGSNLWVATQRDIVLFDAQVPLTPKLIATEQTEQWAMTVSATEHYAYVGDWGYLRTYERTPNVVASDLDLSVNLLQLQANGQIKVRASNFGNSPLQLQGATSSSPELIVEASSATLDSGESGWLRITTTEDFDTAEVCIASNDPDEPVQRIKVTASGEGGTDLGTAAPDFTLVDLEGQSHTLSDYRGQPVLLCYFATW